MSNFLSSWVTGSSASTPAAAQMSNSISEAGGSDAQERINIYLRNARRSYEDPFCFQEKILATFSQHFKALTYDKAKEAVDSDRDRCRNTLWAPLLQALGQLAVAERQYVELTFLQPKGFLRKDNSLKSSYDTVRQDLTKLRQQTQSSPDELLAAAVRSTRDFVSARLMLIEFYTMGVSRAIGAKSFIEWRSWDAKLQSIMALTETDSWPRCLNGLKLPVELETGVLKGNLAALAMMDEGRVFESMPQLQMSKVHLNVWSEILQVADASRKASFTSSFLRSSSESLLFQWMNRLKDEVKAKFGLYFNKEFQEFPTYSKERAKQPTDYVAKIQAFQKKTDSFCVCLIFDGTSITNFKGLKTTVQPDALFTKSSEEIPRGLELYPSVFEAPEQASDHIREYLPSIVNLMDQFQADLEKGEKPVHFHDMLNGITYFMHRVDPHMTLICLYDTPRAHNDPTIIHFMEDLGYQLRLIPVFTSLRAKK